MFKGLQGAAEPSHSLCDKAAASYAKDVLTRIEWKEGLNPLWAIDLGGQFSKGLLGPGR